MNRLIPLPFYTFLKIVVENGGITPKKIKNLTPWLIKTILFEPLRWIELAKYNKKINQHRITKNILFSFSAFTAVALLTCISYWYWTTAWATIRIFKWYCLK